MAFAPLKEWLNLDVRSLWGPTKQLLGLDIGSSAIKLVQIKEHKGRYVLQKFGVRSLEPEVIVDGTVMDVARVVATIKDLLEETDAKLKQVAMSISGHSVIVKKITLPPMSDDELEEQVQRAAEQYIPFDINEVNLDFHILNPLEQSDDGQPSMSVLLVAAKKEKVSELVELVRAAGLTPAVLDVDAFAIENMYGANYGVHPDEVTALVNIGASVLNVNILKGDAPLFTRDVSIGGNRYTELIQRDLGVSYDEAEAAKKGEGREGVDKAAVAGVIDSVNAEVSSEIARSVDHFKATYTDGDVNKIFLCGGCAKVAGLAQQLQERMGGTIELADPFHRVDTVMGGFDPEFLADVAPQAAVGVGLALRSVGDR
ncbi:MAG: type IV pilus assembly protein PilM [Nitrospira sp.]|nr:type IV pilus assembly protein PilM [Nitrospira sp.]